MEEEHQKHFTIVGYNIRRFRKEQRLSQHQLAVLCDKLQRPKLSLIENGRLSFEHVRLIELARALNVEVADLVSHDYYNEHGPDA